MPVLHCITRLVKSGTLVSSPNLYPSWEIVSVSVLFKVLDFKIVMPTIWNIEQEKDREKENVDGRPAKINEKKGDRDLEREIKKTITTKKKTKETFFCWKHENFVAAVTNTSGHQCKVKMSGSEREHDVQHFLQKTSMQKNGKEMFQKSVLHVQSCFLANYTYCCFFHRSCCLRRFALHDKQTLNIIESFAFSPG